MIKSLINGAVTTGTTKNLSSLLVTNFTKPILYRKNFDQIQESSSTTTTNENIVDNRPNKKQNNIDIKEAFSMKPVEINSQDLIINEDTLKTNKNRIVAMPFDYNYANFYKNKRSTKKKFTTKNKHLRDFGCLPHIFPESMFRDYYMQPIPLSKVQEGNIDN